MKKIIILFTLSICLLQLNAQSHKSFSVQVTGKGAPMLFIPGYSCSGEVWKETVAHYSNRYECHVLTLAGFAGVPAIDTPFLQTVKNDIIAYAKNKHLRKPILVGHSLGAFMSLWVSSEAPTLFGKVICVDGLPFVSALNDPNANAEALKKNPLYNMEATIKNFENLPDSGFIDRTSMAMKYQVADTARARQIATWQYLSNRRTLGIALIEMSTTDLRPAIANIKQPVLMLGSIYGTKETSYKLIGEQFKNLTQTIIHVADSKHFIMYDQPEWMYNEINTFLEN